MKLLRLVATYCHSRNLDFHQYLIGLFSGLSEETIPAGFVDMQTRYHLELLKKV
jgi:hypothetical protein